MLSVNSRGESQLNRTADVPLVVGSNAFCVHLDQSGAQNVQESPFVVKLPHKCTLLLTLKEILNRSNNEVENLLNQTVKICHDAAFQGECSYSQTVALRNNN